MDVTPGVLTDHDAIRRVVARSVSVVPLTVGTVAALPSTGRRAPPPAARGAVVAVRMRCGGGRPPQDAG